MYKYKSVIMTAAVAGILTLSVLAVMSSTNQAFAQAKPTSLSLNAFPSSIYAPLKAGAFSISGSC
jgi:hypothetical protein